MQAILGTRTGRSGLHYCHPRYVGVIPQTAPPSGLHTLDNGAFFGVSRFWFGSLVAADVAIPIYVKLAPNNSLVQAFLGNVLMDAGRIEEGIQKMRKAIRLCPFPIPWYLMVFGAGYHLNRDNNAAITALNQAIEREPESHLPRVWLASTLAEIGRLDEAKAVSKDVLDIEPKFSALRWASSFKSKSHERLKENLLAAGLPE